MHKVVQPGLAVANLLLPQDSRRQGSARRLNADLVSACDDQKLPAKIYGVMAATTLLTFTTLTTGYQLLFTNHPFA